MVEVGSHLVRGGQGQRRAVEENRMSAKAEVKFKVYNFKMFNLQKSFFKKFYLKQETLAAPCKQESVGSREQWPSCPLKGRGWLAHRYHPAPLASTTILHRPSMRMLLLRGTLTWEGSCSRVFYKPEHRPAVGLKERHLLQKQQRLPQSGLGWVVHYINTHMYT